MQKLFYFILLSFCYPNAILFAQKKSEPLVINVQLSNCRDKYLFLVLEESTDLDTLWSRADGSYYVRTFSAKKPQQVRIVSENIQISDLFVAPGYNLIIKGDGSSNDDFEKTKTISGMGAQANLYQSVLDSILKNRKGVINFSLASEIQAIDVSNRQRALRDSVARTVFKNLSIEDKYLEDFYQRVLIDNQFLALSEIVIHFFRRMNVDFQQAESLLAANYKVSPLHNIDDEKYLASNLYREFITGTYLDYITESAYRKDSSLRNRKTYRVEQINRLYKGKVREYAVKETISKRFFWSMDIVELNEYKEAFEPFVQSISNEEYKKAIEASYTSKLEELQKTQVGKPAPGFVLQSSDGKTYNLSDFKGKVVYLDFWASWCHPCREETPHLQAIFDKYQNDRRVVFISIAVDDREKAWRQALQKDKPTWLQLLDHEDNAKTKYAAYMIPKFVLVDKEGNIASFDAPLPSDKNKLIALLEQEMSK